MLDASIRWLVKVMRAKMPCTGGAARAWRIACASGLGGGTGPGPAAATAIAVPPATATTTPAMIASRRRVETVRRYFIGTPPFSSRESTVGRKLEITLTGGTRRSHEWRDQPSLARVVPSMCRLFGMTGGPERVQATFWLVEAPDSLALQSRREPDGTGLGAFDEHGRPNLFKQALAAYEDHQFAQEARELSSRTFIAHVRYASTGAIAPENTHPFEQRGRLFAHNGVIGELERLDEELGSDRDLVRGETDSERFFALITREIEHTGDVGEAIARAARWVAQNLPVYALNIVLTTPSELWALRYPDTHELRFLVRAPGGPHGGRHLDHASRRGTIRVRSAHLAALPAVVVATEEMDEDPGWRALEPGQLLHVGPDLSVSVTRRLERPPARPLTLADLDPRAAASQAPAAVPSR